MSKKHEKKHRKHGSKSSSCSDSSSSSSKCKNYKKIYRFYKKNLLQDSTLMLAGTDAYASIYHQNEQMIPLAAAVTFDFTQLSNNVDHPPSAPGFHVRKSGVYLFIFYAQVDQPSQFMVFINAVPVFTTTVGQNAGAGELIMRHLLILNKDDAISIRNYSSAGGTITIPISAGGTLPNTNTGVVIRKIAVHPNERTRPKKDLDLCKSDRKLFKKLLHELECDPDLMLMGTEAYGSFYRITPLELPLEASVVFEKQLNVKNLELQPNSSDIKIKKDGIYDFLFLVESSRASQFTVFVNGVPNLTTTSGISKGANQLYMRNILALNAGDVLSIRNHISAAGDVLITQESGGQLPGVNAVFIIKRIANLQKEKNMNDHGERQGTSDLPSNVEKFKQYLLLHDVPIEGSDAYFIVYRNTPKSIAIGESFKFPTHGPIYNVHHMPGSDTIIVGKSGIYQIHLDVNATTPSQFTIFVNGIPDTTTTDGTDSGAGQTSLRQLLALKKGDKLTVVNWKSQNGNVQTSLNAGGTNVSVDVIFTGIKIAPLYDC